MEGVWTPKPPSGYATGGLVAEPPAGVQRQSRKAEAESSVAFEALTEEPIWQ